MERIRKALDRAKAEREAALGALQPPVRAAVPQPPVASPWDTPDEAPPVELTGRFLSTRELSVDAEHLRRSRLLSPGMQGIAAHTFKMLRTQVLQRLRARKWNTLAVVSATPGDGKTMVAINLAMAISMHQGHSALLVDFDLRHPSIAERLGIPADPGVEECLATERPIEQAFVRLEGYDRLMILPAGSPVVHSSELLASDYTRKLVAELSSRYADRVVLFDLPPLLGADDALAFLPAVDAALVVVGEGHTRAEHLTRSLELLKDIPIVGTVLNRSRSDANSYYAY